MKSFFTKSIITSFGLIFLSFFTAFHAYSDGVLNPDLDWQIYETEHFRIHYTPEYKDWMLNAAHEMEIARDTLLAQQNRQLAPKVDVVVFDPNNDSNGFAISFSHKPFMALFTTSPLSNTTISNADSLAQLLSLHEYVHLVHLAQPDRRAWVNTIRRYYDLYDAAASGLDRWVAEGYATLLESKLTGRGRLFDAKAESMLQQFAREGALPYFHELSKTQGRFKIGSMAYLVGGRFLAWLEKEYSEQALDAVWTRVRGKTNTNFEKAFKGIFRKSPKTLYNRFIAEYTRDAMNAELQSPNETLWLDAEFNLISPQLSPDHSKLLAVEVNNGQPSKVVLNVYSTETNQKAIDKFNERNESIVKDDPQDIPDKQPLVFNSERLHQLNQINSKGIRHPRWLNESTILFIASTKDSKGIQHQDLFKWSIDTNKVSQITRGLNLRRFDVARDSNQVIAERNKFGKSSLVSFSLEQSQLLTSVTQVDILKSGGLSELFDFPRFNPKNAQQLAYLSKQPNDSWRLKIATLKLSTKLNTKLGSAISDITDIALPKDYQFLSFVNWTPNGEALLFVASQKNKLIVYKYDIENQTLVQLTNGASPIESPMLWNKDDKSVLLYSSVRSSGPNLYYQELGEATNQHLVTEFEPAFDVNNSSPHTAARLENVELVKTGTSSTSQKYITRFTKNTNSEFLMPLAGTQSDKANATSIPYNSGKGLLDQNISLILAGTTSTHASSLTELGIKGADIAQRLSWSLSTGFDSVISGYSGYVSWKGWPVDLSLDVYNFDLSPRKQGTPILTNDEHHSGVNLAAKYDYGIYSGLFETYRGQLGVAYIVNDIKSGIESDIGSGNFTVNETVNETSNSMMVLSHQQSWSYDVQSWAVRQSSDIKYIEGDFEQSNLLTSEEWTGHQGKVGLGFTMFGINLDADQQWLRRNGNTSTFVRMGGLSSNLFAPHNQPNWIEIRELPFNTNIGNQYDRTTITLSESTGLQLYYSKLSLDENSDYKITGLKGSASIDMVHIALTGLQIYYGLAQVTDPTLNKTTEGWLGIRYNY